MSGGSTKCLVCEAGKSQHLSAQSLCNNCEYGRAKAAASEEDCSACQPVSSINPNASEDSNISQS